MITDEETINELGARNQIKKMTPEKDICECGFPKELHPINQKDIPIKCPKFIPKENYISAEEDLEKGSDSQSAVDRKTELEDNVTLKRQSGSVPNQDEAILKEEIKHYEDGEKQILDRSDCACEVCFWSEEQYKLKKAELKGFLAGQEEAKKENEEERKSKEDAIFEMLNLLDEKVTKINNRFSKMADELGYKV